MNTKQLQAEVRRLRGELTHLQTKQANPQPAPTIRRYTKGELLEHYAECPVVYFTQFDGFGWPNAKERNECWGNVAELRRSGVPVRIQIAQGVPQFAAVRILKELCKRVASDEGARALAFTVEGDNECPF